MLEPNQKPCHKLVSCIRAKTFLLQHQSMLRVHSTRSGNLRQGFVWPQSTVSAPLRQHSVFHQNALRSENSTARIVTDPFMVSRNEKNFSLALSGVEVNFLIGANLWNGCRIIQGTAKPSDDYLCALRKRKVI